MKRNISVARRAEIGQAKRVRTRAAILSAAFRLLGREQGLATRTEEICQEAQVSRGTLYNYFDSTSALFEALSFEIAHDFNETVRAIMATLPAGAVRSAAAIRYYLRRTVEDPAWGWAMVNLSAAGPIFGAETFRYAGLSITEGREAGQFTIDDDILGRDLMVGTVLASMETLLRNERGAEHIPAVVRHVLSALGVAPALIAQGLETPLPDPDAWSARPDGGAIIAVPS